MTNLKKGNKLPKILWRKGKSKYLFSRCRQEGINYGDTIWDGSAMPLSPLDQLYKKLGVKK